MHGERVGLQRIFSGRVREKSLLFARRQHISVALPRLDDGRMFLPAGPGNSRVLRSAAAADALEPGRRILEVRSAIPADTPVGGRRRLHVVRTFVDVFDVAQSVPPDAARRRRRMVAARVRRRRPAARRRRVHPQQAHRRVLVRSDAAGGRRRLDGRLVNGTRPVGYRVAAAGAVQLVGAGIRRPAVIAVDDGAVNQLRGDVARLVILTYTSACKFDKLLNN